MVLCKCVLPMAGQLVVALSACLSVSLSVAVKECLHTFNGEDSHVIEREVV